MVFICICTTLMSSSYSGACVVYKHTMAWNDSEGSSAGFQLLPELSVRGGARLQLLHT